MVRVSKGVQKLLRKETPRQLRETVRDRRFPELQEESKMELSRRGLPIRKPRRVGIGSGRFI